MNPAIGDIVRITITGMIGAYYGRVLTVDPEITLQVVDRNGEPNENWSAVTLGPGDYNIMETR